MHSALFVVYLLSKSDLRNFPCLRGDVLTYRQASGHHRQRLGWTDRWTGQALLRKQCLWKAAFLQGISYLLARHYPSHHLQRHGLHPSRYIARFTSCKGSFLQINVLSVKKKICSPFHLLTYELQAQWVERYFITFGNINSFVHFFKIAKCQLSMESVAKCLLQPLPRSI